ncbi:hypothetical protein AFLA_011790 [Aspergillus flavus NRRL3357]|nr:hypothetical protein AFLA_011790 [Aspergillus flavus NRRL3357]
MNNSQPRLKSVHARHYVSEQWISNSHIPTSTEGQKYQFCPKCLSNRCDYHPVRNDQHLIRVLIQTPIIFRRQFGCEIGASSTE